MKQVLILVRRPPLSSSVTAEALRVALGMTLADHQVTVLYIDDGAGAVMEMPPELDEGSALSESSSFFAACHVREVVEEQSLKQARVKVVREGIEVVDRSLACSLIRTAETVLSF